MIKAFPLFQLPRGITGCLVSSTVDVRDFRKVLYAAARDTGFTVDESPADAPVLCQTFVRALVSFRGEQWQLLLHCYYPYVAFTSPDTDNDDFNFEFRNCDRLAVKLSGYTALTPDVLNLPVSEHAIALLDENERRDVKYWSPQTLGEIVFNFWD